MSNSASPAWQERFLRRRIRLSLEAWSRFVLEERGEVPAQHHVAVIRALEELSAGRVSRLMLLLPPGSAKSTYASVLFPAWWMARNPRGAVIAASHTAALAEHFGRRVRALLMAHGPRLDLRLCRDARSASRFATETGGEYFAIGVQGAVTGRRADLALIDDPVASFEDAERPANREHLWNWYRSELLTRLKPGGRVALVMTRWHQDDLAGRLEAQGGWRVLRLPALAAADDPLERQIGDALWPDWESREALLAKQLAMGDRSFAAMFQQTPLPDSGTMFDVGRLEMVDCTPAGDAVRGWDFAGGTDSARDPDWTVGVLLFRDAQGRFFVDDVRRVRVGPEALDDFVVQVAQQDGAQVIVGLPRDPGQAGMHQASNLVRRLAGFRVRVSAETGSKRLRADPPASQVAAGRVSLRRADWNRVFIEELAAFPHGRKDDQVDAFSRAFGLLAPADKPARFMTMPFFER